MANEFKELAKKAKEITDKQFQNELSGLTSLNDKDVEDFILQTGISKADLASVLHEVKNATQTNESAANAIRNISKGVEVLISVAKKFL